MSKFNKRVQGERKQIRSELNRLMMLPVKFAPDIETPVSLVDRKIRVPSLARRDA